MEINSVTASSFNGWAPEARPLVKTAIDALSEGRAAAGKIARKLGEHSPHHILKYEKGVLIADDRRVGADSFEVSAKDIAIRGFGDALKKMDKFVAQQNTLMPKRSRRIDFLWERLLLWGDRRANDKGIRLSYYNMPGFFSSLIRDAERTNKSFDVQNILRQLKSIDEKAIENGLQVRITPYRQGGAVIYEGKNPLHFTAKHASLSRLDETEEFIDAYAKEIQAAFPDWSKLERLQNHAQPAQKKSGIIRRIINTIFPSK
ncbi:MAG: hypothetical protein K6A44_02975 [bacterium]|nr:hypothetical protein [bacterium]